MAQALLALEEYGKRTLAMTSAALQVERTAKTVRAKRSATDRKLAVIIAVSGGFSVAFYGFVGLEAYRLVHHLFG